MQLSTYAQARMAFPVSQSSCLERKGAVLALHVNTMYMTVSVRGFLPAPLPALSTHKHPSQPLLVLFANFFAKSYLRSSYPAPRENGKQRGKR